MLIESTMLMEKEGKFDSSSHLWKLTDITVSGRGNNSESSGESRKYGREERKVEESGNGPLTGPHPTLSFSGSPEYAFCGYFWK